MNHGQVYRVDSAKASHWFTDFVRAQKKVDALRKAKKKATMTCVLAPRTVQELVTLLIATEERVRRETT